MVLTLAADPNSGELLKRFPCPSHTPELENRNFEGGRGSGPDVFLKAPCLDSDKQPDPETP